jgi:hypothetical protein
MANSNESLGWAFAASVAAIWGATALIKKHYSAETAKAVREKGWPKDKDGNDYSDVISRSRSIYWATCGTLCTGLFFYAISK